MDQQKEPTLPSISGKNKEYKIKTKIYVMNIWNRMFWLLCAGTRRGRVGLSLGWSTTTPSLSLRLMKRPEKFSGKDHLHLCSIFSSSLHCLSLPILCLCTDLPSLLHLYFKLAEPFNLSYSVFTASFLQPCNVFAPSLLHLYKVLNVCGF